MLIEITIEKADLADTLAAMREWLDRERCILFSFRHEGEGAGAIVIKAEFATQACAQKFQQRFGGPAV
jgi:hypothetical protein